MNNIVKRNRDADLLIKMDTNYDVDYKSKLKIIIEKLIVIAREQVENKNLEAFEYTGKIIEHRYN